MKRVAQVIGGPMNLGGVESFIMNMFSAIDASEYVFDFVCKTKEEGIWDTKIRQLGGRIFNIDYSESKISHHLFKSGYRAYYRFFKSHPEFDVVHIHSYSSGNYEIAKAAKRAGIQNIVYHLHSVNCGSRLLNEVGKRWLLRSGVKTVACGNDASLWGYGKVVALIHNAIDLNKFAYSEEKAILMKQQLGLEPGQIILGNVGRISVEKNQNFILDIAKTVNGNKVFVIVGDGFELSLLKKRAETESIRNVLFLGNRSDISDLFNVFDAFLLPSIHEGLPLTAIEAQANGLRCFFSDGVTKEANLTGENTYLSLSKPNSWSDALNSFEGGRKDYKIQLQQRGYDIGNEVKQLEKIYEEE